MCWFISFFIFFQRSLVHAIPMQRQSNLHDSSSPPAIYIDLEEETKEEADNKQYSRWSELPDLLLEKIFSYLSIREKYYCSLVCKSWHRAFYLPYVWSQFVLEDTTLTRGRFNYYSGWQVSWNSCVLSVNPPEKYLPVFLKTAVFFNSSLIMFC